MGQTSIEWTDRSVNPIRARNKKTGAVGHYCEKCSSGCAHCYSSNFQPRFHMPTFGGVKKYPVLPMMDERGCVSINDEIEVFFDEGRLKEVFSRKIPTKWFWCDMTDLFGPWVPDAWIDKVFAVAAFTPHHTHQILSKRTERMAEYLSGEAHRRSQDAAAVAGWITKGDGFRYAAWGWPLPNVWAGTSVENQQCAEERIVHLLRCPAAVRFLSVEPLLGQIHLEPWWRIAEVVAGPIAGTGMMNYSANPGIHWAIVGGESGHGARPMNVEWVRSIVAQCKAANVPVFVKQMGAKPYGVKDRISFRGEGRTELKLPDGFYRYLNDKKGGNMEEFPADLRVREMPAMAKGGSR